MKLTIELVPKGAWNNNLRSYLTSPQWDKVRRKCYEEAGHVCEICGGVDAGRLAKGHSPVDCHERWDFGNGTIKLIGLIALCPSCHEVKHIGRADAVGRGAEALRHFMKINKVSEKVAREYIREAFILWRTRSGTSWTLDVGYLEEYMGEKFTKKSK